LNEDLELINKTPVTCTWQMNSDCEACNIEGELNCKWKKSHLQYFWQIVIFLMIPSGFGFVLAGFIVNNWYYLLIYIIFWFLFFGILEIRVLCSHCPYYQENDQGFILHCLANHGTIKIWKYRPEPLAFWEKISFLLGAGFFVFFPIIPEIDILLFYISSEQFIELFLVFGLIFITLLAGFNFYYKLRKKICPKCVNFSCPLNSVEKTVVDSYLKRNVVMREAWEKTGYKMG
jgi:hypothetical protein